MLKPLEGAKEPSGHPSHLWLPIDVLNLPSQHLVHTGRPCQRNWEKYPAMHWQSSPLDDPSDRVVDEHGHQRHDSLDFAPTIGEYEPTAHGVHAWLPETSLNVPAGHSWQAEPTR